MSNPGDTGWGTGAAPPPAPRQRSPRAARQAAARSGGPALEATYQWLLRLIPRLEKFPRSQKFLLGDRLQAEALAVLDHLIAATYTREREQFLRAANLGLEKLGFGVRLCKDLRYLDLKAYEHAARSIDEIGCMVGGWIRSCKENSDYKRPGGLHATGFVPRGQSLEYGRDALCARALVVRSCSTTSNQRKGRSSWPSTERA